MVKKKQRWVRSIQYYNLAFSFGLTMIAAILLGLYGGWWLDRRLETFPLFMLLGIFLGIGIGFYSLWRELNALNDLKDRQSETESEQEKNEQRK
ncbi:MAG: AtpZ/AtpI family protein [Firmicutes bacterium]|nr:AtpZ/AtpI family protein [Bacillota bacterium]